MENDGPGGLFLSAAYKDHNLYVLSQCENNDFNLWKSFV